MAKIKQKLYKNLRNALHKSNSFLDSQGSDPSKRRNPAYKCLTNLHFFRRRKVIERRLRLKSKNPFYLFSQTKSTLLLLCVQPELPNPYGRRGISPTYALHLRSSTPIMTERSAVKISKHLMQTPTTKSSPR